MKIKRTEKRIAAPGAHPFFADKKKLWTKLKVGEEVEIPKTEFDSIKAVFGDSIEPVEAKSKIEEALGNGVEGDNDAS